MKKSTVFQYAVFFAMYMACFLFAYLTGNNGDWAHELFQLVMLLLIWKKVDPFLTNKA